MVRACVRPATKAEAQYLHSKSTCSCVLHAYVAVRMHSLTGCGLFVCVRACVRACVRSFVLACVRSCVRAFVFVAVRTHARTISITIARISVKKSLSKERARITS
jgi:hypothetical protein